jgi:membrane-bound ClpP family serine protease
MIFPLPLVVMILITVIAIFNVIMLIISTFLLIGSHSDEENNWFPESWTLFSRILAVIILLPTATYVFIIRCILFLWKKYTAITSKYTKLVRRLFLKY